MVTASSLARLDYPTFHEDESLSRLIGQLVKYKELGAPIFSGKKFLGIFWPLRILKSRLDVKEITLHHAIEHVPTLKKNDDTMQMCILFFTANAVILPLIEKKYEGTVHVLDLLSSIGEIPAVQGIQVKEIRQPSVIYVHFNDRVDTALALMREHQIDRLPVVGDDNKTVGFLSYFDLLDNFYIHHLERDQGQRPRTPTKAFTADNPATYTQTRAFTPDNPDVLGQPVENFMNHGDVLSISRKDFLPDVAQKMKENHVLSLVIVEESQPIAIITKRDLLEAVMLTQVEDIQNIQYKGLHSLPESDFNKQWIQKIASFYAGRFRFMVHNEFAVIIHFRVYKKAGERHKYSINSRVHFPGGDVPSNNADDWDIHRALHKSLQNLENALRNLYHYNKKRYPSVRKGEV